MGDCLERHSNKNNQCINSNVLHIGSCQNNKSKLSTLYQSAELTVASYAILRKRKELAQTLVIPTDSISSINNAELIGRAYLKWGLDFAQYLDGDFAFFIYDSVNEQLLCGRDPMGNFPLYYNNNSDRLLFSSQIKAIKATGLAGQKVNRERLAAIAAGHFKLDKSITFYQDVQSFLPGHIAIINKTEIRQHCYWQIDSDARLPFKSNEDTLDAFRHLLSDTINSFFQPEYKVGSLLSGGLDSSAIVSIAATNENAVNPQSPLTTFSTVPFESNAQQASSDSKFLGLYKDNPNVTLNWINDQNAGPLSNLTSLIEHMQSPLCMVSHYHYQLFGQAADDHGLDIVLDGVNGELGATYNATPFFRELLVSGRWSTLLLSLIHI